RIVHTHSPLIPMGRTQDSGRASLAEVPRLQQAQNRPEFDKIRIWLGSPERYTHARGGRVRAGRTAGRRASAEGAPGGWASGATISPVFPREAQPKVAQSGIVVTR